MGWQLMLLTDARNSADRFVILNSFPFCVGRRDGSDLTLRSESVSRNHAVFHARDGQVYLEDLGSSNGTYVNCRRVQGPVPLGIGDVIAIADIEFRVGRVQETAGHSTMCVPYGHRACENSELKRIMSAPSLETYFQPIVKTASRTVIGYEALVRSSVNNLKNASELFMVATRSGLECELSQLCRSEGIRQGRGIPGNAIRFLNTHPTEMSHSNFLPSLRSLRDHDRDVPIILEIHEGSVCDSSFMQQVAAELRELNIGLAYDDFGQGQSRLLELVRFPPDVLKFDIELIRDIDRAPRARQSLLASLVQMVAELGIQPLAEGVETASEFEACSQMGFELVQGYYCGRPTPAAWILAEIADEEFGFGYSAGTREVYEYESSMQRGSPMPIDSAAAAGNYPARLSRSS